MVAQEPGKLVVIQILTRKGAEFFDDINNIYVLDGSKRANIITNFAEDWP